MHPSKIYVARVAYSLTSDVSGTYRTGVLGSRAWIWMYVARHLKEQELGSVRSSSRLCDRKEDNFSRYEMTRGRKPAETNSRLSG